jgi:hypothetical protein
MLGQEYLDLFAKRWMITGRGIEEEEKDEEEEPKKKIPDREDARQRPGRPRITRKKRH